MRMTTVLGILGLGGVLLTAGIAVGELQQASAESRPKPAAASKTKDADAQVATAAQPPSTTAPAWSSRCTSAARDAVPECAIEQTAILNKTGQMIASISVRMPPSGGSPVLMIHVPVGLYLPAGIDLKVDDQAPLQLAVQTCDLKGCYAGTQISAELLKAMKSGKKLTVTFRNLSKQNINVPMTLAQFAEAYQRIQ